MEKLAMAAVNAWIRLSRSSRAGKKHLLTSYWPVLNSLLAKYVFDDIIVEADTEMMDFKDMDGPRKVEYVQALWSKDVRLGLFYHK